MQMEEFAQIIVLIGKVLAGTELWSLLVVKFWKEIQDMDFVIPMIQVTLCILENIQRYHGTLC